MLYLVKGYDVSYLTLVRAANIAVRALFLLVLAGTQDIELVGKFGLITGLSAWLTYVLTLEMSTNRMRRVERIKCESLKLKLTGIANSYYVFVWGVLTLFACVAFVSPAGLPNVVFYVLAITSVDVFFSELVRTSIISANLNLSAVLLTIRYFISSCVLICMAIYSEMTLTSIIFITYCFSGAAVMFYFWRSKNTLSAEFVLNRLAIRWFGYVVKRTSYAILVGSITKGNAIVDRVLIAFFMNDKVLGYYVLFSAFLGAVVTLIESETTSKYLNLIALNIGKKDLALYKNEYLSKHRFMTIVGLTAGYLVGGVVNVYFDYFAWGLYLSFFLAVIFYILLSLTNSTSLILVIVDQSKFVLKNYCIVLILASCLIGLAMINDYQWGVSTVLMLLVLAQLATLVALEPRLEKI